MSRLDGELNFATVPALVEGADALIADAALDLSGVSKTDSAGLALLLELTRRARARGTELRLTGASGQVRELIRFFDLESVLTLDGVVA